ncbi:MAG: hypothetical protein KDC59_04545 [Saprospiraceae bacterium]|nr:hypothetical protein [Saprospiraceae bacterium]HPG06909.1 hypothetical protein [Saprospiraceae bacterium]
MTDSKIYQSLVCLDVYQGNRFIKFLQSPYFNKKELIAQLVIYLLECHRVEHEPDKLIFWATNQTSDYDDAAFRRLCNEAIELLEEFLTIEQLRSNKYLRSHLLLEGIDTYQVTALYKGTIRKAQQIKEDRINMTNLLFDFLIERDIRQIEQADSKRYEKSTLDILSNKLDTYYIIEKLRIYSLVYWQKSFLKEEYKIHLIDQILEFLKSDPFPNNYIINLYYHNLLMLVEPEKEEYFLEYKKLLLNYAVEFLPNEAFRLIYNAINYSIRKLNQGQRIFRREIWELYKFALESNILIDSKNFDHWDYRNIVTAALQENEYGWAREFIDKYKEYLEPDQRENAFHFNLALLNFYEKKYDEVVDLLNSVEYTDLTYNLNAKVLLIATYYELDEIDALESSLSSFKTYIYRKDIVSEDRRKLYNNYVSFLQKIIQNQGNQSKLIKLRQDVEQVKNIASKPWLLEKINELIGEKTQA